MEKVLKENISMEMELIFLNKLALLSLELQDECYETSKVKFLKRRALKLAQEKIDEMYKFHLRCVNKTIKLNMK